MGDGARFAAEGSWTGFSAAGTSGFVSSIAALPVVDMNGVIVKRTRKKIKDLRLIYTHALESFRVAPNEREHSHYKTGSNKIKIRTQAGEAPWRQLDKR